MWNTLVCYVNGATCLCHRGTGRAAAAAGPARGWPRSRAAAGGRTHTPPGRWRRREVCPEEEVCCPPSLPTWCVLELARRLPGTFLISLGRDAELRLLGVGCPESRVTLVDTQWRQKQRLRRCAKNKLRPSPCANFVLLDATNLNISQMPTLKRQEWSDSPWLYLTSLHFAPRG